MDQCKLYLSTIEAFERHGAQDNYGIQPLYTFYLYVCLLTTKPHQKDNQFYKHYIP